MKHKDWRTDPPEPLDDSDVWPVPPKHKPRWPLLIFAAGFFVWCAGVLFLPDPEQARNDGAAAVAFLRGNAVAGLDARDADADRRRLDIVKAALIGLAGAGCLVAFFVWPIKSTPSKKRDV